MELMFTVEDVADKLSVSKVTIYAKLKKFEDKVVLMQGKKYITEDLLSLIKKDLKLKESLNDTFNIDDSNSSENIDVPMDNEDLIKLNKDLINALLEQLKEKDKQIKEKDNQIDELHKLIENNQVLLKQQQDKEIKKLQLEEHFQEVDQKLLDLREKMEIKKSEKKSFFKIFS